MRRWWLILFIGIVAVICCGAFQSTRAVPAEQTAAKTTEEEHKVLVRRWIERGFNERYADVVDELFSPNVTVNDEPVGHPGLKRSMRRFISAFSDLRVTTVEVIAEGDKVVMWYTVQGTQTGEFEGIPPTRKQVRWYGADFFRIEKGKIVECRFLDDSLGLLRQLGTILSPPH
jgi:steroid delta-isomerase-like uncharacterized protein